MAENAVCPKAMLILLLCHLQVHPLCSNAPLYEVRSVRSQLYSECSQDPPLEISHVPGNGRWISQGSNVKAVAVDVNARKRL